MLHRFNEADPAAIDRLPADVRKMLGAYGPGYDPVINNPATALAVYMRFFDSLEGGDQLGRIERMAFEAKLPVLTRFYPGQIVALNGTEVVGAGNLDEVYHEYARPGMPPVEFFFVPTEYPFEIIEPIMGPSEIIPD